MSEQVVIDRERESFIHFSFIYTLSVMANQKINFIHFCEHMGSNSWLYIYIVHQFNFLFYSMCNLICLLLSIKIYNNRR